jgi:hypothetical protein
MRQPGGGSIALCSSAVARHGIPNHEAIAAAKVGWGWGEGPGPWATARAQVCTPARMLGPGPGAATGAARPAAVAKTLCPSRRPHAPPPIRRHPSPPPPPGRRAGADAVRRRHLRPQGHPRQLRRAGADAYAARGAHHLQRRGARGPGGSAAGRVAAGRQGASSSRAAPAIEPPSEALRSSNPATMQRPACSNPRPHP